MNCPENIETLIGTASRELALRRVMYPKWVREGKMDAIHADKETVNQVGILNLLKAIRDEFGHQGQLPGLERDENREGRV